MPVKYDASQVDEIVDRVVALLRKTEGRVLISLAGIPGSGKSSISAVITEQLTNTDGIRAVVLPQDGYHYYRAELSRMPNAKEAHFRRGAPFTFNASKFVKFVSELRSDNKSTKTLWAPSFSHDIKDPIEHDIEIGPGVKVVIIEGNYVSLKDSPWDEIEGLVDDTWFCAAPLDVVRGRIIGRHIQAGLSKNEEEAADRVDNSDLVNARYILQNSKDCQVIINND